MRWLSAVLIVRVFAVGCDCGHYVPPDSTVDSGVDAGSPDAGPLPDAGMAHDAGTLDLSFGDGGVVLFSLTASDQVFALAVQPDGRLMATGTSNTYTQMGLARFKVDGTPDLSFGDPATGGLSVSLGTSSNDLAFALALRPDAGIVAMGTSQFGASAAQFAVVQLSASGTIEPAFGASGPGFTVVPVGGLPDNAAGLVLAPDGRVILAGVESALDGGNFAVVRLLPDGTLDPSFNSTGVSVFATPNSDVQNGVALQADGAIVVSGKTDNKATLVRFTSGGLIDPSFGAAGIVIDDLSPGADSQHQAVLIQPDGKVVTIGYMNGGASVAVVRYTSTGARDPSFGANGIASPNLNAAAYAGFIDSAGRIVFAGRTNNALLVGRVLPNGALDATFGPAGQGWASVDPGGNLQFAFAAAQAPNGQIVIGGMSSDRFVLARFWP